MDIEKITLPNSIESIGNYTFDNCISLTSIILPNNLESIGDFAFYNCNSLTKITLPKKFKKNIYEIINNNNTKIIYT